MDADQLAETTMDPRHRTLRRVRIADAEAAERIFELLMGNDVAPRKDFIVDGAERPRPRAHRRLSEPDGLFPATAPARLLWDRVAGRHSEPPHEGVTP